MDQGTKQVGIIVDGVAEVLKLEKNQILEADNLGSTAASDNVLGMGKVDDRLIILLDLTKVLSRLDIGEIEIEE